MSVFRNHFDHVLYYTPTNMDITVSNILNIMIHAPGCSASFFRGIIELKNDVSVFQSQNNVSNSEKKIWVFVCLRESRLSTAGSWKVPERVLRIKMKDSIRRIILIKKWWKITKKNVFLYNYIGFLRVPESSWESKDHILGHETFLKKVWKNVSLYNYIGFLRVPELQSVAN